jgi:hypothetical protein
MGGLVVRQAEQLAGFLGTDSFGYGYVHELITIGTPHLGSPLAGCGKTASFMKIATHIMPDKRYAGPKSCLDKLSACICGSFCPLLLRAGTLLP